MKAPTARSLFDPGEMAGLLKPESLIHLWQVRMAIEVAAVRLATELIDQEGLERLEHTLADHARAMEQGDFIKYNEADLAFHQYLIQATGNPIFLELYETIRRGIQTSQSVTVRSLGMQRGVLGHSAILDAVRARPGGCRGGNAKSPRCLDDVPGRPRETTSRRRGRRARRNSNLTPRAIGSPGEYEGFCVRVCTGKLVPNSAGEGRFVERQFYLDLVRSGLRMPIGADLVLHERSNPDAVLRDGRALGQVVEDTARRYRTPWPSPTCDLQLEKDCPASELLGVPAANIPLYHFLADPGAGAAARVAAGLRGAVIQPSRPTLLRGVHRRHEPTLCLSG